MCSESKKSVTQPPLPCITRTCFPKGGRVCVRSACGLQTINIDSGSNVHCTIHLCSNNYIIGGSSWVYWHIIIAAFCKLTNRAEYKHDGLKAASFVLFVVDFCCICLPRYIDLCNLTIEGGRISWTRL